MADCKLRLADGSFKVGRLTDGLTARDGQTVGEGPPHQPHTHTHTGTHTQASSSPSDTWHWVGRGPVGRRNHGRLISTFAHLPAAASAATATCALLGCLVLLLLLLLATWAVARPTAAFLSFPLPPPPCTPPSRSFPILPIPEHMGMSTSGAAPGCTRASCTVQVPLQGRPWPFS